MNFNLESRRPKTKIGELESVWQTSDKPHDLFKTLAEFRSLHPQFVREVHLFYTIFIVNITYQNWSEILQTAESWSRDDEEFFRWLESFQNQLKKFGAGFRQQKLSSKEPLLAQETMLDKLFLPHLTEGELKQIYVLTSAVTSQKISRDFQNREKKRLVIKPDYQADFDKKATEYFRLILPNFSYFSEIGL